MSIVEWFVNLFGGKKTPAYQISSSQTDGWGPSNAPGGSTKNEASLTSLLPIAAIAVLATQLGKGDDEKGS
ncbi:MAG: hypothetical protein FWD66_10120 [Paludibacter sp.]|nr:hypothetical protein [Paludibacter sp.]